MLSVREEISKNLLYYRKKAGLTQKQLAEKIDVKNTAVSNWESGNNSIDIDTLCLVCDVFGITLNDIYGGYSEKSTVLSADEMNLIATYREISDQGKQYLLQTLNMVKNEYKKRDSISGVGAAV